MFTPSLQRATQHTMNQESQPLKILHRRMFIISHIKTYKVGIICFSLSDKWLSLRFDIKYFKL